MKNLRSSHLAFAILLFVCGFIAHALLFNSAEPLPAAIIKQDSTSPELKALNDEIVRLQSENDDLHSQLEIMPFARPLEERANPIQIHAGTATAVLFISGESPLNDQRFKDMMRQQVNHQLDIYAARLGLSDDQRSPARFKRGTEEPSLRNLLRSIARYDQWNDRSSANG